MSSAVLTHPAFMVLATAVAFNTLIYVGLTIAKVLPWPRQFRPSQVRTVMRRIGLKPGQESAMHQIPRARPPESEGPVSALRFDTARRTIPQAFAVTGSLVMVFAVFGAAFLVNLPFAVHTVEFLVGLTLLFAGVVLWYSGSTGRAMTAAFAVAATLLVFGLLAEGVWLDAASQISYAIMVMTAFMPVVLGWRAALFAGASMLAGVVLAAFAIGGDAGLALITLGASALLVGAALLELRLRALRGLAREQALSAALATTDPLTGLLAQRGLLTMVPAIAANAARSGRPVFVVSIRIAARDKAYHQYGLNYVEEVMRTVADVITGSTRTGDLVARWDADHIVVFGQGRAPDAASLARRFDEGIAGTAVALGRWPITVDVGCATGEPDTGTFDALLEDAQSQSASRP